MKNRIMEDQNSTLGFSYPFARKWVPKFRSMTSFKQSEDKLQRIPSHFSAIFAMTLYILFLKFSSQ